MYVHTYLLHVYVCNYTLQVHKAYKVPPLGVSLGLQFGPATPPLFLIRCRVRIAACMSFVAKGKPGNRNYTRLVKLEMCREAA